MRQIRASFTRRASSTLLAASFLLALLPGSAAAFPVKIRRTGGTLYYSVSSSFPSSYRPLIDIARRAWQVQYLSDYFRIEPGDSAARIYYGYVDGTHGTVAWANVGCSTSSTGCEMMVDSSEAWHGSTSAPPSTRIDLLSVLTHEFGHWAGLYHSVDRPSTHATEPTMYPYITAGTSHQRSIAQDDVNSFLRTRTAGNFVANWGYETDLAFGWKFRPSATGGSMTRYCNDHTGAKYGACFVEFNGSGSANASVYQDIVYSHPSEYLYYRAWVRNRDTVTRTVTVAVWDLDRNRSENVRCSIPPGQWVECRTSTPIYIPSTSRRIRFEVYGPGPRNLDVDGVALWPSK
ncbi:MAG: M10 family metallopeptidase domain-containing protein [Actinomycetota bacterium]|nr:M10 family metallopeptidase domain-containing protein [Actinomycetota bacterium]